MIALVLTSALAVAPDQLVAGQDFACWLKAGEVACFGNWSWRGRSGLPPGELEAAARVPDLAGVVALASGKEHVCALDGEARVWCWGARRAYGQLAAARDAGADGWWSNAPFEVVSLRGATQLWAGDRSTCARLGGALACVGFAPWLPAPTCSGSVREGTLRCPEKGREELYSATAERWPFFEASEVFALGEYHACWRRPSKELVCLGFTDTGPARPATVVARARGATALVASGKGTCALAGEKRPPVCWFDPTGPSTGLERFGPSERVALNAMTFCTSRGDTLRCDGYLADVSGVHGRQLLVEKRPRPIRGLAIGFGFACVLDEEGVACIASDPAKPKGRLPWRTVGWPR